MITKLLTLLIMALTPLVPQAEWVSLLNGRNLDGWEVVGDGVWTVMRDGTLVGQRDLRKSENQSWLYTKKQFGDFDLHVEWWTRLGGNSGVSILDASRGQYACGPHPDHTRTPSHVGYEIQIDNGVDEYPTGSIYLFAKAKSGLQFDNDWNSLDVETREQVIRVKVNGHAASELAGDHGRPKVGPIGLQLHDRSSLIMFRNIRIKEIPRK